MQSQSAFDLEAKLPPHPKRSPNPAQGRPWTVKPPTLSPLDLMAAS